MQDTKELQAHFEVTPKLYKGSAARQHLFAELFSKSVLNGGEPLEFGRDLVAARYVDGRRQTLHREAVDSGALADLFAEGCTLQVHQPQRWSGGLWRLVAALEAQLGCLVGTNAYLTPAGTQGLAPHFDDVEIWVLQTEGAKRWRLYGSPPEARLPAFSSPDLPEEGLGKPVLDVTLEVGDVLYMPRGTIHQAVAQSGFSCHVTVSSYQRWSLAAMSQAILHEAQAADGEAQLLPPILKQGLPWGFLYRAGKASGIRVATGIAKGLRALADIVEQDPQLLSKAADGMAADFMQARAPPHPLSLPERGPAPTLESRVRCVGNNLAHLFHTDTAAFVLLFDEERDRKEDCFVQVVSCLDNSISTHMMGMPGHDHSHSCDDPECHQGNTAAQTTSGKGSDSEASSSEEGDGEEDDSDAEALESADLVFPASFTTALAELLAATDQAVKVSKIRLPDDEKRLGVAFMLWSRGILCTETGEKRGKKKHLGGQMASLPGKKKKMRKQL